MSVFAEVIDLTANLKALLGRYRFGNGILRELLANSEDAGATKQVFVLDYRNRRFSSESPAARLLGPALLAYNDATFSDTDWEAVKTINKSSKSEDKR